MMLSASHRPIMNLLSIVSRHQMVTFVAIIPILMTTTAIAQEVKWESITDAIQPDRDSVSGRWSRTGAELRVQAAEGARLMLPVRIVPEYDIRIRFTRQTGRHSIGLVIVQGGHQTAFEVDAWGMNLAGFQNVAGQTIQNNPTKKEGIRLQNNREYSLTVEVRRDRIRGLLDEQEIAIHQTDGSDLSMLDLWKLPDTSSCGLLAWDCDVVFHTIEVRPIGDSQSLIARREANRNPGRSPGPMKQQSSQPGTLPTTRPGTPAGIRQNNSGKRVLLVIANHHFFYREYAEPRRELEQAGIAVTVAAGRRARSQPHSGSGEGPDGGQVMPEIALSDVRVSDYDAILFSGGWGASMYQYAFEGRYNEAAYNGNREIKREANRLVTEFLAAGKPVCALCNATSVLAWARVDGKSPLEGKLVCAPTRQAPPGVYQGRTGQPSCRWHAEVNGARMSPPGSIGQPGTAADDIAVDGLIVTGEDDISAAAMGRRIVELLQTR